MAQATTTADLIELVRPLVGMKLGYDRPAAVDIVAICNSINADVRAITAEGFEKLFDGQLEFVRWSDVRRITIRTLDADGSTVASATYEHDLLPAIAKGQRQFARSGIGRGIAA